MAGNAGGHRDGMVKDRIQYENPKNGHYVKVDKDTGKIIDVKSTPGPYKGIENGNK